MDYVVSQIMSNFLAYYYSFGSRKYLFGWQLGPLAGLSLITARRLLKQPSGAATTTSSQQKEGNTGITEDTVDFKFKTVTLGILFSICFQGTLIDVLEMSGLATQLENSYTLYRNLIIHWGLQAKVNFVTSLAACNADYERMQWFELWGFIKNLVVKPYCLYGVVIMAKFFRKWRKSTEPKTPKADVVERAKKYILEDFLEENHVSMQDMSTKETEAMLNDCLNLLEKCDYDYERYKKEKTNLKKDKGNEHLEFMNDIKKLKEQIHELRDQKDKKSDNLENDNNTSKEDDKTKDDNDRMPDDTTNTTTNNTDKQENFTNCPTDGGSATTSSSHHDDNEQTPSVNGKKSTSSKSTYTSSAHNRQNAKVIDDDDDDDGGELANTCNYRSFHYIYSFLQMAVFTLLGLSVRKLFFLCFTQGCVLGSTVCSSFMSNKNRRIFWTTYLLVFLTSVVNPGIKVSRK